MMKFKLGLILLVAATFLFIPLGAFAYDSFDSPLIDSNKWEENDHNIREILNGKLRMGASGSTYRHSTYLHLATPVTGYLESKINVQSGSLVSGNGKGFARIGAYFYNSELGPGSYNEYQGNVWGDVRIVLENDNSLTAMASLWQSTAPDQSAGPVILDQSFTKNINFDTEYTLSMELKGSEFIFRCGDEEIIYQIQTPVYAPYEPYHHLTTRTYPEEGSAVSVKALFDDVKLEKAVKAMPWIPLLLLNESDSQICGVDPAPPGGACPTVCTGGCSNGVCLINCNVLGMCRDQTLNCPPGFSCQVECDAAQACENTTVNCPEDYTCEIACEVNNACQNMDINCSIEGVCNVMCGGASGCDGVNVNCGDDACTATCGGTCIAWPTGTCGDSCDCSF